MTLEQLEQQRAAIPDDDPALTRAETAAVNERRRTLDQRLVQARLATVTLRDLPSADADQTWLDQLESWRKVLCDELLALPPRIRDPHTLGVQMNVTLSIRCIDFGLHVFGDTGYGVTNTRLGELMRASGYEPRDADPARNYAGEMPWHGSIKETEHRLRDLERRRAAAQSALDEALLDDDERAKRDAEADIRREALNKLPTRKVRGDGTMYDKYPDGRRVEVDVES